MGVLLRKQTTTLRWWAVLILGSLLAGGCRSDPHLDSYLALLNAEKRQLEDELYNLEYDYEQKREELETCRQENEQLREELGLPAPRSRPDLLRPAEPRRRPGSELQPNHIPDLTPPMVDPGVPFPPEIELPDQLEEEEEEEEQEASHPLPRAEEQGEPFVMSPGPFFGQWTLRSHSTAQDDATSAVHVASPAGSFPPASSTSGVQWRPYR